MDKLDNVCNFYFHERVLKSLDAKQKETISMPLANNNVSLTNEYTANHLILLLDVIQAFRDLDLITIITKMVLFRIYFKGQ